MLRLVAVLTAIGLLGAGCSIDRLGKARPDGSTGEIDADVPDIGPFDVGPCLGGCDDGIACTIDACVEDACRHTPSDALCTVAPGGRCDPTGCQYPECTADVCTGGPCEAATCEGGTCVRTPLCGPAQMCCAGSCVAAGCDDGNPCTDDSCDDASGCVHADNFGSCDDGDSCTDGDRCGSGGSCRGSAMDCADGNSCTDDFCDPGRGGCVNDPVRDGTLCRDGLFCTVNDSCVSGVCRAGPELDCPNPCNCDEGDNRCEHMGDPSGC